MIDPKEYVDSMNEFASKLNDVELVACLDRMKLTIPVVGLQLNADLVVKRPRAEDQGKA